MKFLIVLLTCAALAKPAEADWDARGRAEFAAGHFRDARRSFERAVAALSSSPALQAVALANLGQTLIALSEWTAAEEALRSARRQLPGSGQVLHLLGQILLRTGRRTEATALFEETLQIADGEPDLQAACYSDLSEVLLAEGRREEAADALESALQSAGPGQTRGRILFNLGILRYRLGDRRRAEFLLSRALIELEASLGPAHPDLVPVLENYADIEKMLGNKSEARRAADRALRLRREFVWQANASGATIHKSELR